MTGVISERKIKILLTIVRRRNGGWSSKNVNRIGTEINQDGWENIVLEQRYNRDSHGAELRDIRV